MLRGEQVRSRNGAVSLNGLVASGSGAGAYQNGALIISFPYANLISQRVALVSSLGQIVSCAQGYTLVNNQCILRVTQNCLLYSPSEHCIQCAPQYTLTANFTCELGLKCASINDVLTNGRCLRCA